MSRRDVYHTAKRVAAVERGRAAAQDFYAVDGGTRDSAPVNPAAERVIERDAVGEDNGPAGPARADAAQRDSLRSRVRGPAARAPEQSKAWNLAERVVEGRRRGCRDIR